jgi:hypothetical protein
MTFHPGVSRPLSTSNCQLINVIVEGRTRTSETVDSGASGISNRFHRPADRLTG